MMNEESARKPRNVLINSRCSSRSPSGSLACKKVVGRVDWGGDRREGGKGEKTRSTAKIEKTYGNRSFWGMKEVVVLSGCFHCKAILRICQMKGPKDSGQPLSPSALLRRLGWVLKGVRYFDQEWLGRLRRLRKLSGKTRKGGERIGKRLR